MTLVAKVSTLPLTYEEFLEQVDEDTYAEWVNGSLWLHVSWLWQDPPPCLLDVLREWGLV